MGFGRLGEREGGVDARQYLAPLDQRPDLLLQRAGDSRLEGDRAGPQRRAGKRQPLGQKAGEIDVGDGAVQEGDLADMAVEGGRVEVALDIVAAHHVEDDVGATAATKSSRW